MGIRRVLVTAVASAALAGAFGGCGSTEASVSAEEAVSTASSAASAPASASAFTVVDSASAERLIANPAVTVLDVRTPEEYEDGHIDGAQLIDFYAADFKERIAALDRETPYFVYCRSGNRSGQAVTLMRELGFRTVYDLAGGILDWTATGHSLANS